MQMDRPTLSLILDTRRAKEGMKYPLKLRITYLRKQHYLLTGFDLTEAEYKEVTSERPKKKYADLNAHLQALETKAWSVIGSLPHFTFAAFSLRMGKANKSVRDIYPFIADYIETLREEKRIRTASSYHCMYRSLQLYCPNLSFQQIDVPFLKGYEKWMLGKGNSITTVGIYLRSLRTIFNQAIVAGLVLREVHYPFGKGKYVIPAARNIKKALSIEEVKLLIQYPTAEETAEDYGRDLWVFSYLCNGMNIKDVALLQKKNVEGEFLRFVRAKTKNSRREGITPVSLFLLPPALHIIQKWGTSSKDEEAYLFPILTPGLTAEKEVAVILQCIKQINKYMKRIGAAVGITKHITTYTSRHSFATILKQSGASMEYISESLGHHNMTTTKSYLDSFEDGTKKKMAAALINF